MSSTVGDVPAARSRGSYILRFLKDAKCSLRVVKVRLFKTSRLSDRAPMDRRRWGPSSDLAEPPERSRSISPTADPSKPLLLRQTSLNRSPLNHDRNHRQ
jgi:hypothetical protein